MTTQNPTPFNVEGNSKQSVQLGSLSQQTALRPTKDTLTVDRPKKQVDLQPIHEYAELKSLINQRGLLDKQLGYYAYKFVSTLGLLALSLAILAFVDTLWVQLVNAVFMAFVFTQIAYIGHDVGHRQIFRSARNNEITGLIVCFMLALERSWWIDKHNRHHNNPNHLELDPDADFPILAFTKEQAVKKKGVFRFIVKYQAFLFIPMLLLEGLGLRIAGVQYLVTSKIKYPVIEPLLMVGHFVAYFGLLLIFLSGWHAVFFIIIHQALFGLFLGSAFAPNHKGMLMVREDEEMDFLRRQVLTARNVKGHPITDMWYGALNYQIEHHLFPAMPRNNLKEAQIIVRAFCEEHSISYHETGVVQSVKEILQYLHQESAPLRGE